MPTIHYLRGRDYGVKRIFLAVPTYSGSVGAGFLMSFFEAVEILGAAKISIDLCVQTGNCHVDDARNAMVREFLKTDCTDMVFIDEDVGFRGEDLLQLVTVERDMVAGVYPCKQDDEEFPVRTQPGKELWTESDGCVEVEGVPTGFLRMSRALIEKMVQKFGQRKFYGRGQENDTPHHILFERTYEAGVRYSGDYAFCRKWRSIGGKIYVIPEMHFTHTGEKAWSGCLGDYWKRIYGVAEQDKQARFDAAIESLGRGTCSESILSDLFAGWGNPDWSAGVELLESCIAHARQAKGNILECGSGLSTLVLALSTCQHIWTLEHDPIWASHTHRMLQRYGIKNVTLIYAPLKNYGPFDWYDVSNELPPFDLVICDGPPRTTRGNRAGIAIIEEQIASGATVIVDDPGEYLKEISTALGVEFDIIGTKKPFAIGRKQA